MTMTLESALDHVHVVITSSHLPGWKQNREAWDVIRAHISQPAQAVDVERVAQLIAHRACCGTEHDPLNGKLHGYCVVCGVPWPCEYAGTPLTRALSAAQAEVRGVDLQPEDSRCPPTYRREEAVKALIGMGWTWDGKQWSRSTTAESPLSKLHKTLLLRAKALKESGDEWMEDMGEHYAGIAEELAAALLPATPAPGKEGK